MDEEQYREQKRPVWERHEQKSAPNRARCQQGEHIWMASFFESGRLAFWECVDCGEKDREMERFPERLDTVSGWIQDPPRLVARGHRPPVSTRRWVTADGAILIEGEPSSIHFVGVEIPGLVEAHTYVKQDEAGQTAEVYEPMRKQPWAYTDHYWLIRYQVVGAQLVRFESSCYEDSTYEVPHAGQPSEQVLLSDLRRLLG